MAKLQTDAITQSDLLEFIEQHSDFSFEVQTLKKLRNDAYDCDHGGTYDDPATGKPREFDIRATKAWTHFRLRLAVECKNIRDYAPLLITRLPRRREEAYVEVAIARDPNSVYRETGHRTRFQDVLDRNTSNFRNVRLTQNQLLYMPRDFVGKCCEQVGRNSKNEILATTADIYDKWAQALSSADALTHVSCIPSDGINAAILSFVLPVVVVPNGRLWVVDYDDAGNRIDDPKTVERCAYYVGRSYSHGHTSLTVSHLEFVTFSGLEKFEAPILNGIQDPAILDQTQREDSSR